MKIAYLINQYPKISHTFIRREIAALERLGFHVSRIAIRGWDSELVDILDEAERAKTFYLLKAGLFRFLLAIAAALRHPSAFARAVGLAWQMSKLSRKRRLVHLAYLLEACLAARVLRRMKAQHVHAHFGTNSAEVAMLQHALGGPTWSFTVHASEEFDDTMGVGINTKVKEASFVVAVSSFGRSQVYRWLPHSEWHKVHVIHCSVDAGFLSASTTAATGNQFACVGRFCEQKGHALLIEAFAKLRERHPSATLVLAGDGELRPQLERQIRSAGLGSAVRITGWIDEPQVRAELTAARALVLPSFSEGLPVVLIEALALERPVISTYIAGIPELVSDGVNGWLVPAGDVDALVEAMETSLAASPEQLAQMGRVGKRIVTQKHDPATEAKTLAALFQGRRLPSPPAPPPKKRDIDAAQ